MARPAHVADGAVHAVNGTTQLFAEHRDLCAAVDWLVAVVLAIEIIAGAGFHH
jgi:hypothetical protein